MKRRRAWLVATLLLLAAAASLPLGRPAARPAPLEAYQPFSSTTLAAALPAQLSVTAAGPASATTTATSSAALPSASKTSTSSVDVLSQ